MPGQLLIYKTEDGRAKIEARLEVETVWLSQALMSDLFQTNKQNISLHLQNIFEEKINQARKKHNRFLQELGLPLLPGREK